MTRAVADDPLDDGGALVWELHVDEHALLLVMLDELDEALHGPTDDAVVQRLFPPAVEGDEDGDAELRALIASDLLLQRHEAIATVRAVLGRAEVSDATDHLRLELVENEPGLLLGVLNDLRLALASRVGLTAVQLPQLVDDERTRALLGMMDHFALMQMQLLAVLDPVAVAHAEYGDDAGADEV